MWVYPLDDTYIHLQIAKNIADSGYFGYTSNEFCSCSSSPLYTFLLAICHKVFGGSYMAPFILNVAFANALIIVLFCFLKKRLAAFLLMSVFLMSPVLLPIQVFSGMEHTLHILLITTALIFLDNLIIHNYTRRSKVALILICCFLCLTRYESMFFVVSLSFILLFCKQYRLSIGVFLAGFLPVVFFGLFSMSHGGWFFPNSLLLKGNIDFDTNPFALVFSYVSLFFSYLRSITFGIPILFLLLYVTYDFINKKMDLNTFARTHALTCVVVFTIILHSMFASRGWLFRYEAYLYTLLYLISVLTFFKHCNGLTMSKLKLMFRRKIVALILLPLTMMLCVGLSYRTVIAIKTISYASKNIYDQQIQMARFLQTYYNTEGVMANDVGAIGYFTNIRLLDIVGLTNNNILAERRASGSNWNIKSYVDSHSQILNRYPIIIVYDVLLEISKKSDYERLGWIKTAELSIPHNVICGDSKVSFYTSNRDEVRQMVLSLKDFKKKLPKDVILNIFE